MADSKSKRRSRKKRSGMRSAPRAVPSQRRERDAERAHAKAAESRRPRTGLDARGERPDGLFGPVPVSEIAILVGGIAVVVGVIGGGGLALIVGTIVCALGVLEVTAREHFTGYRSHALLLAAFPAVAVEVALYELVGGGAAHRGVLLAVVIPLYALVAWWLRGRYRTAHHARSVGTSAR